MLEREDTPWHPTMRLFRQKSRDERENVFADLGRALVRLRSAPQGTPGTVLFFSLVPRFPSAEPTMAEPSSEIYDNI